MKKLLLSIVAIATISLCSFGQAPEGFKYQAVVRDAGNTILNNQAVGMRMTIQQGSIGGTTVYSETFSTTTNAYGLVNLEIGNGTAITGTFSTIDWANGPYFMETAVDVAGGTSYTVMGTSQLMSVPYALHANTANNVINDQVNDADSDPSNEIQDISLSGANLTLSSGSTIDLSVIDTDTQLTEPEVDAYVANNGYITNPNDADSDPSNEIQDISLSGANLTLSSGSTIDLSVIDTDTQLTETEVDAYVANNGYITNPNDADSDPSNEIQDISLSGANLTLSSGSTIDLSVIDTDTHIDSLGIVNLGFVAPIDYILAIPQPTGEKWIDGKLVHRIVIQKVNPFTNWTVLPSSTFETIVKVDYMIIGDSPAFPTTSFNDKYGSAYIFNGNLTIIPEGGNTAIYPGSIAIIYYTLP